MRALIILLIAGAAAGCTVGPDYKRPILTVPDTYRGAATPEPTLAGAVSMGDQTWWDVFQDDQLRELMRTALQQNLDLRIAATHKSNLPTPWNKLSEKIGLLLRCIRPHSEGGQ